MGPGIVIPVLVVAVAVPAVFLWARKTFKEGGGAAGAEPDHDPKLRLTSNALRALPTPPWRVVYEIAPDKLGGIEHVLIGPAGVFALVTSMDPLPAPVTDPDPHAIGRAAIVRGALDDALRRCAMSSDSLVAVHWGVNPSGAATSLAVLPGSLAVDGRALDRWAAERSTGTLTPAQVDLAWQTVLTSIGRPDPLA